MSALIQQRYSLTSLRRLLSTRFVGLFALLSAALVLRCASTNEAAYHLAQEEVQERGSLSFAPVVSEYINAFPHFGKPPPPGTGGPTLRISQLAPDERMRGRNLAQLAVTTNALATGPTPTRGFIFIVDTSGSMLVQNRLQRSLQMIRKVVTESLPEDTVISVITTGVYRLVPPTPLPAWSSLAMKKLSWKIAEQTWANGTMDLGGAIERAGDDAKSMPPGTIVTTFFVSDGRLESPSLSAAGFADLLTRTKDLQRLNFSTVSVGTEVNSAPLRQLAAAGGGFYFHLTEDMFDSPDFAKRLQSATAPAYCDVSLDLEAARGISLTQAYGYKTEGNTHKRIVLGKLAAPDQRIVMVEYQGNAKRGHSPPLKGTLEFRLCSERRRQRVAASFAPMAQTDDGLPLDPEVARNATIFSDALALGELKALTDRGALAAALHLAQLQQVNIDVVRRFDTNSIWLREKQLFASIAKELQRRMNAPAAAPLERPDLLHERFRQALSLAANMGQGPWTVLIQAYLILDEAGKFQ